VGYYIPHKRGSEVELMRFRTVLLLALLVALLAGLAISQGYPVTVVDDRGKEIVIPKRPERIVVAGVPLYTEILFDIGAGDRLVGVTDSPDNPPEAQMLPKVGPALSPSVEKIIELQPDVVFGAWGEIRDALEAAGIIVFTTKFVASITDIFTTIRIVGLVVGNIEEAEKVIGHISEEIVTVEGAVLGRPRPKVAILYAYTVDAPPFAAGSGTPENELILRAGGANVFADVNEYPQVSFEEIIATDPEFIFTDPAQIPYITGNERLKGISAIKSGKVFGIKASSFISTRVAKTLRAIAEILHPEAFR